MVTSNIKVKKIEFTNLYKINEFNFRRLLFVTEISFLGLYEVDWQLEYEELKEEPVVKPNSSQIQILTKVI